MIARRRRRGRATPTLGGANVEQVGSLGTKMLAKMDGALTRSSASSSSNSSSSRRRRSPCGRRSCARAPCRRRAPPSLTSAAAIAITTTARAPSSTRNKARGARLSRPRRRRRHQPPRHSRRRSLVSPSRGLSRGVSDRAQSASMLNESVAPLPRHASIRPSEAFSLGPALTSGACLLLCWCVRLEMRSCEPRRRRATSPSRPRACSRR